LAVPQAGSRNLRAQRWRWKADVFGEHGEEAALEEAGADLSVVAVGFEGLDELGKAACDIARDFGGAFARIERVGIGEDEAEAFADLRIAEIR
jgi:hypothetical protein